MSEAFRFCVRRDDPAVTSLQPDPDAPAQRTLAVSWLKRRKKGRESVPGTPSRFIKEMALDQATVKEDPREKLRALRAEFAARSEQAKSQAKA